MERVREKELQSRLSSEFFPYYYNLCNQPFIHTGHHMEPTTLSYSTATHLHHSAATELYYNTRWIPQPLPQPSLSWLPPPTPFAPTTTSMEQPETSSLSSTNRKQKEKPFQQLNHQPHTLIKKTHKKLPKYKHKKISNHNKK
jgi:hypothetical protein